MKEQKEFTGSVYIGVVGSEEENGLCRDSIEMIVRRPGDEGPYFIRGTKGYEAREAHIQRFLTQTKHDFILLLDQDQLFPSDTLERLRAHKLPYVTGLYMRRQYAPIVPVWFELGERGVWPMVPMTTDPERGKLHPLGASGWGCVLIHRSVFEAMRPILKGEPFVIEDDLDVWPYDLGMIHILLKQMEAYVDKITGSYPRNIAHNMKGVINCLRAEFRPLRGGKDPIGSDIRFPFYAREVGFTLMGDPDVRVSHQTNYMLTPDDYSAQNDTYRNHLKTGFAEMFARENAAIEQRLKELA